MGRNMPRASKYSSAVTGKVAQYGVSQFIPIELATNEPFLDNLAFVHCAISKERGVDVFAVVKRTVNTSADFNPFDAFTAVKRAENTSIDYNPTDYDPFGAYSDACEAIVTYLYRARYNSRTVRRRAFPGRYVSLRRVRIARRRRRRELRRIAMVPSCRRRGI